MKTNPNDPLVRLGQGDYTREIRPNPTTTADGAIHLDRVLIREPADIYHARRGECLTSHRLAEFRSCPLLFRRKEMGLIPDRDIDAFGYVHQLAFYRALLAVVSGVALPVHIIAVEKREPFRCGVWQIAPRCLDAAQAENDRAIEELVRCRETGRWTTGFESLRLYDRLSLTSQS